MKQVRLSVTLSILGLGAVGLLGCVAAAIGSLALVHADDEESNSRPYVITINDSLGNFISRGLLRCMRIGTMSATDSGQGSPEFFFSSQLGSWKPDGTGGIVARTIDFDFPRLHL